jgi:hypothetical protein
MALPPKGDPRRPLHLAIRSTRMLGILFLSIGSYVFYSIVLRARMRGTGRFGGGVAFLGFYIGPGVAYLLFSIFLKRRQFWAVVAALVLASIQLLFTLAGMVAIVIAILGRQNLAAAVLPMFIYGMFILALAELIHHLAMSFEAIKHMHPEEQRGFEPLMMQALNPPPPRDSNDPLPPQ